MTESIAWSYLGHPQSYLELARSHSELAGSYFELAGSYLLPGGRTLAVYLPNQLPGGSYLRA